MKFTESHSERGISVIELLIVVAIIMVISALALSQMQTARTDLGRQNIAAELKTSLDRARFDSIKRRAEGINAEAKLVISGQDSFSLFTDLNQNGIVEAFEAKNVNFGSGNVHFLGSSQVYPIKISFNRRGFATAVDGNGVNITPVFTICEGCRADNINSANATTVTISPAGATSIGEGAMVLTASSVPALSTVPGGSQIRSGAVITPIPTPPPQVPCTVILILCL